MSGKLILSPHEAALYGPRSAIKPAGLDELASAASELKHSLGRLRVAFTGFADAHRRLAGASSVISEELGFASEAAGAIATIIGGGR